MVLEEAGRLETWQGSAALAAAERLETRSVLDTGSAVAEMLREYRAAMADAMKGVGTKESAVTGVRDELAARWARRGPA